MPNDSYHSPDNRPVWENLYAKSDKVNRYPHDSVVSFVLRSFGRASDRSAIRLLDYGCGGGGNTAFMAAEGFTTYAIDVAPSAVIHARKTVAAVTSHFAEITAGDFAALPYDDGLFDAIVDRQSLGQNGAAELPKMVNEIARVLKPGGLYFGVNFSSDHPQLRFGTSLGNGDYANFSTGVFKGIGFRHFFDTDEIRRLFHAFTFRDLRLLRQTTLLDPDGGSEEIIVLAVKNS